MKILITGATGLIGRALCKRLTAENHEVSVLVRDDNEKEKSPYQAFLWDYEKKYLEESALDGVEAIVHLAGSPIAVRWTKKFKNLILESRVNAADFLLTELKKRQQQLQVFVSASAIGYYGAVTSDKIFTENDSPAQDFLGKVCQAWEAKADEFKTVSKRVVVLRTSGVLSNNGGLLQELKEPIEKNVGSALGSGKQWMPWIHIDDMVAMYQKALEDTAMEGAYNAATPEFVNNKGFVKTIAKILEKKIVFPKVPAFMLKLMFGEMSNLILKGSRVSVDKIEKQGFKFKYPNLDSALKNLLK